MIVPEGEWCTQMYSDDATEHGGAVREPQTSMLLSKLLVGSVRLYSITHIDEAFTWVRQ